MTVWKSPPSALHSLSITVSIFSCVNGNCKHSLHAAPGVHKWRETKRTNDWKRVEVKGKAQLRAAGCPRLLMEPWTRTEGAAEPVSFHTQPVTPMSAAGGGGQAWRRWEVKWQLRGARHRRERSNFPHTSGTGRRDGARERASLVHGRAGAGPRLHRII